ncbi:Cof subfamily protein (haloacid dehalogenase superfamily)/HAD superfamily hydrolase (TIGR01484 family) [Nesterenkonia aurantiaca]|uniref:Cof subfamily protein (Haloacid dehalogenase superfamily)/HAD superfamily hydrolase (TIGR01484 family) n=2 Tax=Micrococcaceae TaxID=1268 RepID=A0A4R7G8C6_9MICC|nr:Cof subfamily protein (haloacid dehalogenase superfamily)/HAD superfamily hydrolase (TIGR01484 family) [Nesterenkonia aurantiaca]
MNTSAMTTSEEFSIPPAGAGGSFSHTPGKKMVCLDVDGTIVFHDGRMSEAVKQAGRALVAEGHTVVVSTGRSLPATLPVVETFGIEQGYAVCSNGGVTVRIDVSLEDGYEVLDRRVFDPAPALDALMDRLPNARYAIETSVGDFLSTERFEDMSFGLDARGVSFQEMKEAEAVRLVVNSTEATAEEFATAVQSIGLHGVTYSVGWSAWLDIAAAGVTKGSSLEALRERLAVPAEDTVAVGDGRNDIEMLGWAARGVAMGQAPQEVIDVADELTAPVEEDGLVPVLRSLLEQD